MIVVTGMGAVCALGDGPEAVFRALCRGESGVRDLRDGFGPVARVGARATATALAHRAVLQALGAGVARDGLAVVGASTAGDSALGEVAFGEDLRGEPISRPGEYLWSQLCHRPTRAVAAAVEATGPVLTTSTACTSGAMAIAIAADLLRSGRARAAVAFGADSLCGITTSGFAALGLHSRVGCRPFDAARDGMCLGEGGAALLLERSEDAAARGARPLAVLLGCANAQDAHHLSTPDPAGAGAIRAMSAALSAARVGAADVGYVNAHGTGTLLNDAMEASALLSVFPAAAVSGTKGATGHTLGAAGALEAVITILALSEGLLPPNVGTTTPAFDLDLVQAARDSRAQVAMSVNFAFGGHNTALVFGRAT